jgi:hypothetical protein
MKTIIRSLRPLRARWLIGLALLGVGSMMWTTAETVTLVPSGSTWKYHDQGANLGTAWRETGYDDSSWPSGLAQLGYGDGDEATIVSYGPDANNKYVTTYFRHAFDVTDASAISALTLELLRDDGAVVYLNGTPVASYNMPSTFDYRTYALTATDYAWDAPLPLPPALLVSGRNVLAVEIHQGNATSSDLSFDLILTAEQLLPGTFPDTPLLIAPANGVAAVPTPVILEVSVSDADADALTVNFFGRENVPVDPFTLIVLPDTQKYVLDATLAGIFTQQTQWIVANRAALNIVAVTHEGDVVDTWDNTTQWDRANISLTVLDNAGLPYGILPGNHDIPTTYYNSYFPPGRYSANAWYGDSNFPAGKNDNNFILFSAGGVDFIVVQLQYWPSAEAISWANGVLKAHADRKAIITTHAFLGLDASRNVHLMGSTQYIWDDLVMPNPNVWFVLCGHVHGETRRTDMANGHPVHQILADYQALPDGGQGWLRIMRFEPIENRVYVQTYSPYLNQYQTDADSQFSLEFPMNGFELLGTYTAVPSGSTVSHTWTESAIDTDYQWFVAVTDPTGRTTTSPIWAFSTDVADILPPNISELAVSEITDQSAVVTWSTDEPADSWVACAGTDYGSSTLLLEHRVELGGLASSTTYSLVVSSRDASGNETTDSSLQFTTLAPNLPPTAIPQTVSTTEDSPCDITLTAQDDNPATLVFRIVSEPLHGTLSGSAPNLSYTPNPDFNGADAFTFEADDGEFTDTAIVTIDVIAVDDPPTAPILTATADDGVVHLSWTASIDPDGTTVSYGLYRATDPPTVYTLLAAPLDLAYSDTTVQNGFHTGMWSGPSTLPGTRTARPSAPPRPPSTTAPMSSRTRPSSMAASRVITRPCIRIWSAPCKRSLNKRWG